MMNLIEWLDQYNYVHIKPNPVPDQTENPLTFTATLHVLYKLSGRDYAKIPKPNLKTNILPSGEFITTPISKEGSHFSLDSMTGLYILDYINEYEDNLDLPLMKWYKSKKSPKVQKFYRPDVIVFFMFLKFQNLAKYLFPLLTFFATIRPLILFERKRMEPLLILIGVAAVFVVYAISQYNFFQTARTRIKASIQEIGNQLKRQASLIPNLAESVKGYLKHEKGIFKDLTDARKAVEAADGSRQVP